MKSSMQKSQSNKILRHKHLHWTHRIVLSVVIAIITAIICIAIFILRSQGITQGLIILTIISIIVGIMIGLLTLMINFFQWLSVIPNKEFNSPVITFTSAEQNKQGINNIKTIEHIQTLHSRKSYDDVNRQDWGELPNVGNFCGRQKELAEFRQWIVEDHCQVVAVLGMGGVGKTALSAVLAQQIKDKFDYVFWRSLQNAPPLKNILERCILFLSNQQQIDLPKDVEDQLSILIEQLRKHRCLVVLDNFESILQSGNRAGYYRDGYESFGKLIEIVGGVQHQSCFLLTSREKPREIAYLAGKLCPVRSMQLIGVKSVEGQKILEGEGLFGSDEIWEKFIDIYAGNPLSLKLVSETIRELFKGSIAAFLEEKEVVINEIQDLLNQQLHRLSELEQEIVYWLAIEREAVSLDVLCKDIVHLVSKRELLEALKSLMQRSMIETNGNARFTLQPVIMEHVIDLLVEQMAEEIEGGVIGLVESHAIIKAQTKDYLRNCQIRLILVPLLERLFSKLGKEGSEQKIRSMMVTLHDTHRSDGYTAGNVLNLLIKLQVNLRGSDFSHLKIRQAYLQGETVPEINLSYSDLTTSVFTDAFGIILSVATSSNRGLLAASTATGEIRSWQLPGGTPWNSFQGHTDWVRSVSFNFDGSKIASGSDDCTVRIWDVNTGQCLMILQGHQGRVYSVTFSPNGTIIATGSEDCTVRIWDINTGQCLMILQGHQSRVRSVAFSPDGTIIATGGDDRDIRLWNVSTSQCLTVFRGHEGRVWSVAFSPDGTIIASGSEDQSIRLWKVDTSHCISILQEHTSRIRSVVFGPDEATLISGSEDQSIRLWDVETTQCYKTLQGHSCWIYSLAFDPIGSTIASGNDDHIARIWDVCTGQCCKTLQGHKGTVWSIVFSPDGTTVATGSDDHTVRIWDVRTGRCLMILQGHKGRVYSAAFSPDGAIIASGSEDQSVSLWDMSTSQCYKTLRGHNDRVRSIVFSPDGTTVATGSDDHTARIWDVDTGQCFMILQGHNGRVWSIVFSPDGTTVATGSDDHTVRIWDVRTGRCLMILQGHNGRVYSIALSPDGTTVATGSDDHMARIWDVNSGQCLMILQGHNSGVRSVVFNLDGYTLATGSHDGTIKLWDIRSGECLQTLRSDRPYERMNITNVIGLAGSQKATLKALGAIEDE